MSKRIAFLCVFTAALTMVAGCWDQVQIEERGFVVGIAIDAPRTKETESRANKEAPDKPKSDQRFLVTHQLVIPGGLVSGSQGTGGGQNTANEAFLNLVSEGDSLFETSRELAARTSRSPFYQHLKVLIISEEVARSKTSFANSLDLLLRDPDSRRSTKVFISKGDAMNVMKVKPKTEKIPALYINAVGENINKNARMLPEALVGDVHQYLLNEFSFALPRIIAEKQEVKVAGAAVFSMQNQMVGFLGEEETEGLNFLTGKINGGLLKAIVNGNLVMLNIQGAKRKVECDISDPKHMKFTLKLQCEGAIVETYEQTDLLKETTMHEMEQALAKEIERLSKDTIRKIHGELKVDTINLGSFLKQHHYPLWKKIKNDWEQGQKLYEKSEIRVEAKVYIRNVGGINKAKN